MVLADLANKKLPKQISVVQIVNEFTNWPLNDPYC